MERKWYKSLLVVCLLTMTLAIVGVGLGLANEAELSVAAAATLLLANILGFIGWVWGIVLAVQNRHWVWLVFNAISGVFSAGVYCVVRLKSGSDTGEKHVA